MAETRHLFDVLNQMEHTQPLLAKADEVLLRFASEPLLSGTYQTPQSPPYHSEGPMVRDHLRLMLASLFAITDGTIRLTEIEEFARLKGYEDEIEEMHQTILENAATFEVFCLIHDAGKQFCLVKDDNGVMHYHGHEKEIYRPDVQQLLGRLGVAYRLQERDIEMIVPLISYHLVPLHRFKTKAEAKDVEVITKFAADQGIDADDFIDMLQAVALLDQVMGSRQNGGVNADHLTNFFIAERAYAPWKLAEKEAARALERKRAAQRVFLESGLDGAGVMLVTGQTPGRALGNLLKQLQAAAKGEREVDPTWPPALKKNIESAKGKFEAL